MDEADAGQAFGVRATPVAAEAEGSTGKRSLEGDAAHRRPVRDEFRHALRTVSREEGEESVAIDPVGAAIRHRA